MPFKYLLNGTSSPLGKVQTGQDYSLTNFPEEEFELLIPFKGKNIKRVGKIEPVLLEALTFIDTKCAQEEKCNNYFRSLSKRKPLSLREILDTKTLHIYRLEGKSPGSNVPEGYTFGWGDAYAAIGLNLLAFTDSGNLAGVLLHELAHVAGAPGRDVDPDSLAAERALQNCGGHTMSQKYSDHAKG